MLLNPAIFWGSSLAAVSRRLPVDLQQVWWPRSGRGSPGGRRGGPGIPGGRAWFGHHGALSLFGVYAGILPNTLADYFGLYILLAACRVDNSGCRLPSQESSQTSMTG